MSGPPLARSARRALDPTSTSSTSPASQSKQSDVGLTIPGIIRQDVLMLCRIWERFAARLLYHGPARHRRAVSLTTLTDLAEFFAVKMALSNDDDGFTARFKADMGDALPVRQIGNLWQAAVNSTRFCPTFQSPPPQGDEGYAIKTRACQLIEHRYFNFSEEKGEKKRDGWCCKCVGIDVEGCSRITDTIPPHFCGHYRIAIRRRIRFPRSNLFTYPVLAA